MTVTFSRRSLRLLAVAAFALSLSACYPADASPTRPPIIPTGAVPVPSDVLNRVRLPECGTETITSDNTGWNNDGRNCFINANADKKEAEFVTSFTQNTAGDINYNVYVTMYYRTFTDGHVDVITDGRNSAQLGYKWTLNRCAGIDVTQGDPPVFSGKDPCTPVALK